MVNLTGYRTGYTLFLNLLGIHAASFCQAVFGAWHTDIREAQALGKVTAITLRNALK